MSGESAVEAKSKDWHSSKDMRKRARHLLEHPDEEIPSDVTFLVGDGLNQKMFKCHKFILAMVSSMFQAMFYGSLPETEDVIRIPDVNPAAFQNMLRYAYGQDIELPDDCLADALDTLYCAKKYQIVKLARLCRDCLQLVMAHCKYDPCVVFQRAPQMDEEDLAGLALSGIALCTHDIMEGEGFLRLSFDSLKRIVECPYLTAKEITIYKGVRRWIVRNVGRVTGSALRDAFGTLLYAIRFPLCSATELSEGPVQDGVLSGSLLSSVFQFLFSKVKPVVPFITTPRKPLAAGFDCFFEMLSTPKTGPIGELTTETMCIHARPDLAPESCIFLRHLVEWKCHIRIASFVNGQSDDWTIMPYLGGVQEERNVLSHSIEGACWFEWDMDDSGTARNVRIGVGKKPDRYHSAVFGFLVGFDVGADWVPLSSWNNKHLLRVTKFRIRP